MFFRQGESICLRFFGPHGAPDEPRFWAKKYHTTREELAGDAKTQRKVIELNATRGAYFVVNFGGDKDADIERVTSFYAEIDDLPIGEQLQIFLNCPLPPSILIITRKSVHCYWLLSGECTIEEWRDVQARLIAYFGSDVTIKNPSRVMRLPHFDHIHYAEETGEIERKRVELHLFEPERRYAIGQMLEAFPAVTDEEAEQKREEHETKKNTARFWSGIVCNWGNPEERRQGYGQRARETACNIIRDATGPGERRPVTHAWGPQAAAKTKVEVAGQP